MLEIKKEKNIDLTTFFSPRSYPCVSLFLDNNEIWPQNKKAMKNLKAQLKEIKIRLKDDDTQKIIPHIESLKPLCEDGALWKNIKESLIIYLSPEGMHIHQVSLTLTTSLHIGHFFDIRPLLIWKLQMQYEFFLLKVSQKETKLFHMLSSGNTEIKIEELPQSIKEFTQYDSPEKSLQFYGTQNAPNLKTGIFHGQGLPSDHKKDILIEYGKLIGKKVLPILRRHNKIPLVLAGISPLVDCVKESLEGKPFYLIHKNPAEMSLEDLSQEAKEIILDDMIKEEDASISNFLRTYQSSANTINKIQDIIYNAFTGKVKELYIQKEEYLWGKFNLDEKKVPHIDHLQEHSEDLLNIASIYTLQNGGQVHIFDPEKFSCKEYAIAILR